MSKIQVDSIVNKDDTGAPSFPKGATITGIVTSSGISGNVIGVVTATSGSSIVGVVTATGGSSIVGVVTATGGSITGVSTIGTTNLTVNGSAYPSAGPLSNRNIIVNGGMVVSQRGTSFSLAHDGTTSAYTLDRFVVNMSGADQWDCTVTQSSDTPVGFTSSLLITTGTAENAVAAPEYASVQYKVEAQDLQQIASGTSDAKEMRLSFWIKSSQTGTFAFGIYKADQTQRGLSTTYTINAADTWEYKSLVITGDTGGGGIDNNNGLGMNFYWLLAAGSDWTSTDSTSWINYVTTGLAYGHEQNGVLTNAGATWAITGVQLEVGSVATPFEHRSYGDELRRCQRYYQRIVSDGNSDPIGIGYNEGTTEAKVMIDFPVTMRNAPSSLEQTGTASDYEVRSGSTTNCSSVPVIGPATKNNITIIFTLSGLTNTQANQCRFRIADKYLAWSAEL